MSPRGTVTNQLLQASGMTASPWAVQNLTPTTGQADPFGGTGATRWTETTDGASVGHCTYQTPPASLIRQWVISSFYFLPGVRAGATIAPNAGGYGVGFDSTTLVATGTNGTLATQGITAGIEVVQASPSWRRAWVMYPQASGELRFYVSATGSAANYQGNGSIAFTSFGAMTELALPGQTGPSPLVNSGASAGVGRRDTRQNLLPFSDGANAFVALDPTHNTVADGTSDVGAPPCGTTCQKVTYDGLGASGNYRAYIPTTTPQANGVPYTGACWMRVLSGTRVVILNINGSGPTQVTLTTTWQRVVTTPFLGNGVSGAYLDVRDGPGVNSAGAIYMAGGQIAQTNQAPDFVRTNGAPFNPNGAPRSLVL